jgi:hypothetical protein
MDPERKKVSERFKDELKKYLTWQFKRNEKIKPESKKPREIVSELIEKSSSVFRNILRRLMSETAKDTVDARITKRIEESNKKQTMSYLSASAKDHGRELSQEQLGEVMREYGKKNVDKDLDAIVQERLKKQMKSQINAQLKTYTSERVQSLIEMQSIEKYAETQTEGFVLDKAENLIMKKTERREN